MPELALRCLRRPVKIQGAQHATTLAAYGRRSKAAAAAARRRDVEQALDRGEFADLGARGVHVLTLVGMALALGTLGVIVVQP
jgi:hypothetical protein